MTYDGTIDGLDRWWLWLGRLFSAQTSLAPPSTPTPPAVASAFSIDLATVEIDELIAEHAAAVFRVAYSITRNREMAEDVTQDALIKAWQKLPTFRGESPLRNWILRITHNTAISALRRRREEPHDPAFMPDRPNPVTVERQVSARLALDDFDVALGELDDLSRSIVVLREVEGLSYDDIVDLLDVPLPTVKTRLLRARRHLAGALAGWNQ